MGQWCRVCGGDVWVCIGCVFWFCNFGLDLWCFVFSSFEYCIFLFFSISFSFLFVSFPSRFIILKLCSYKRHSELETWLYKVCKLFTISPYMKMHQNIHRFVVSPTSQNRVCDLKCQQQTLHALVTDLSGFSGHFVVNTKRLASIIILTAARMFEKFMSHAPYFTLDASYVSISLTWIVSTYITQVFLPTQSF